MKSDMVKAGMQQASHRSLFNAPDVTEEEMRKSLVGTVSSHNEIVPNRMSLDKIVDTAKLDVVTAGGTPMMFPAIAVCDGIAMGHIDMKHSLVTRDLIADSMECMALARRFDTLAMVPSCDKNAPGLLMAAARINTLTVSVSDGPMLADHMRGYKTSPSSMFEAMDVYVVDNMPEEDVKKFENKTCPTCGSCSSTYTTNSMNCLTKVLGMRLKGNGTIPAVYFERIKLVKHTGTGVMKMYEEDTRPRGIMTEEVSMNALTMDMALGCSTNSMLHLPATAHKVGVELSVGIANGISARTPNSCYLASIGPTYIEDLNEAGGIYAVMKEISKKRLPNLDYTTITGRTVGENIKDCANRNPGVIRPVENPYSQTGDITILKGDLTPDSAVMKCSAVTPEMLKHEGSARVFDCEEDVIDAIRNGKAVAGNVVVIRYEGPKGGPGMREMLDPTSTVVGMGLGSTAALIADGRFSGTSRGASIGHTSPETAVGDPIALVEEGGITSINIGNHEPDVLVSDQRMGARKAEWQLRTLQVTAEYLAKYASLVTSANRGAVLQVK